ncbi:Histidine kinase-like ATPase [Vigna unguiculata]|uniref:Histidine kinase-like ATPase n=1 Tax=Vigna unguiculata TaxID=3917 RepID=A0A4D6LUT2_VIGUN|nr:Histidine kinase-like ATPase [Vigna unguiculata]
MCIRDREEPSTFSYFTLRKPATLRLKVRNFVTCIRLAALSLEVGNFVTCIRPAALRLKAESCHLYSATLRLESGNCVTCIRQATLRLEVEKFVTCIRLATLRSEAGNLVTCIRPTTLRLEAENLLHMNKGIHLVVPCFRVLSLRCLPPGGARVLALGEGGARPSEIGSPKRDFVSAWTRCPHGEADVASFFFSDLVVDVGSLLFTTENVKSLDRCIVSGHRHKELSGIKERYIYTLLDGKHWPLANLLERNPRIVQTYSKMTIRLVMYLRVRYFAIRGTAMANDKILVLEGEKSEMLSLVKKTFYSNKGIFLRELINASNVNKTLSIIDNGIGMTKAESTGIVYLWNPSTNECKVTPPSPVEDVPYYIDIMVKYEGFGYDCARDDYKVIRYVCYFEVNNLEGIHHREWDFEYFWEIYSLRSNSWRKLNIEFLNCQDTTIFYVSILVEVGKKETWTKLFTIGPLTSLSFPIGTSNMGNILFQTNDGELAWFDLRTNLIKKLGVKKPLQQRDNNPTATVSAKNPLVVMNYRQTNHYDFGCFGVLVGARSL